ncbi:hypothetical protein EC973_007622 [Apophysomyces ossiformis]|uniref:Uncharacterized protein n=1 Tax=Apophysomyces ossiformis TaxID=679940 RepID=A0A8H7EQU3_9FUNG|nr:hypothetical protein EC973_007622 [Apophysomyces ossiformis]
MLQSIESPVANDSVTNKPASQKASLYHTCRSVLDGLAAVPGFEEYLESDVPEDAESNFTDPLSKLWHICRQGSSLCLLYNTLRPEKAINMNQGSSLNSSNKSKACVYHFIIACRDQLLFSEESLFTVMDLYQNDTNGFVKVVNTVKRILDLLEQEGTISICSSNRDSDPNAPKDTRDKVVFEFLETERKYVQDLETLQRYMREAHLQKVLPPDTLHNLFGNLNALVDFQRRFLIQLEDNADRSPQEQRLGNMFIQLEDSFSVYEPFCANFQTAQDLVVQETPKLQKLADILSPNFELPSMLIKPVQRVCKYPLLMQQLVKSTPEDWCYYEEMKKGLDAIQRVASKVNETKRRQENILIVEDLKRRVENWKGSIDNFGPLLLQDKFTLQRNDAGREMLVFLFEKTLLICREDKDTNKKTNTIMKKKKKYGALYVQGKILISKIAQVSDTSQNGQWSLRIFWSEKSEKDPQSHSLQNFNLQSFILKCRNNEQLKQWEQTITKYIQIEKRLSMESKIDSNKQHHMNSPTGPRSMAPNEFEDALMMNYDEDEEEDEYQDGSSDDDDIYSRYSSRPIHGSYQRSVDGEHSRRMYSHGALSLGSNGRSYSTIPGMSLPPLPRSPSHAPFPMSSEGIPTIHSEYGNYTASPSPPTSYPSSPTVSTKASPDKSGPSWQRRHGDDLLASEMLSRNMGNNGVPTPTEECNQFLLCTPTQANRGSTSEQQFHHTRVRSQSSPNIHRPNPSSMFSDAPEMPSINSRTIYQGRGSTNYQESPLEESTKVKVHYQDGIYVVVVPLNIGYEELMSRIERKIRLCGQDIDSSVGLKYQDEDGDLITIISNEDVQMGFENRGIGNAINFYVTSA